MSKYVPLYLFLFILSMLAFSEEMLLPEDPLAGARVFEQKGCSECHAIGGEGGHIGPDLGKIYVKGSLYDIAGILWNHAPMMSDKMQELKIQPQEFTPQEMSNLLAFLGAYQYYLAHLGQSGDPAVGERLFREKSCVLCHSFENSWEKLGPGLANYENRHSLIGLAQMMWNHGPEMEEAMVELEIKRPRFDGDEMIHLLSYIQAGGRDSELERRYLEPGNPNRGKKLFTDKGCIKCHSVRGQGGEDGIDLVKKAGTKVRSMAELAGLLWNHGPAMWKEMREKGIRFIKFSQKEMADLVAYLYFANYLDKSGDKERGRKLFLEKGCIKCHSVAGEGGTVGPDLALKAELTSPVHIATQMWNHAPAMEEAARTEEIPWPRFYSGEMVDILEYLASFEGRFKHK
jgi:cytochrome c2